jgi:hypothetical protein
VIIPLSTNRVIGSLIDTILAKVTFGKSRLRTGIGSSIDPQPSTGNCIKALANVCDPIPAKALDFDRGWLVR